MQAAMQETLPLPLGFSVGAFSLAAGSALAAVLPAGEILIAGEASEGEKPHQGVASLKAALHLGQTVCNSPTALGLRAGWLENRGGSRCTGKERDSETGLDYFGARYYGSNMGRFMTPDPLMASAKISNPQTWNRYAYTLNNPLKFVDPDGMDVPDSCAIDKKCTIVVNINVIYDKTANNGKGLTKEQKQKFEKEQMAEAQAGFAGTNIALNVTYTEGSYTQTGDKINVTGTKSDALNIVVSDATPDGAAGTSGVDKKTGLAMTFINVNEAHQYDVFPLFTNTTEHELTHQFTGDVYNPAKSALQYFGREAVVDSRVWGQDSRINQTGTRTGLEHRSYAVPANPEANKPKQ